MALQTRKRKTRMYEPWGYQEENNYESSGGQLMEDLDKFFADAKYNKDDKKIHFYNQDGEEKANIDVSDFATSVIDSVSYDSTTKILTIKFANGDVIKINFADMIKDYEFTNGLIANNNVVSVLIDSSGEPYLTVSENGLKLDGLDDAIGEKVNIQIESALTEINSAITEINSAITNINSALTNVESSTTYIESSFTYINSAITNVEGDIININSAITNIQGDIIDINSAITIMGDDITEINSAITIIGDNINEVNSAITIIEGDIVEINSAITDIYSSITEINSALTETITDVNINEDADLELMNHDTLLDTVPLTDYYYTKYDISQKELTISAALNDLEDRKIDDVQYNPGFRLRSCGTLKFYSTNEDVKTELFSIDLDELFDNASFTNKYINDVKYEEVTSGESGSEITYQAITFYNVTESGETLVAAIDARPFLSGTTVDLTPYFANSEYVSSSKTINFYNAENTLVSSIDASAFIKDGMVDNVEIKKIEASGETISVLAITFNTDAGKEEIDIPLTNIFDPNNYYTKDEITWSAGTGDHSTVLKGGNNIASGNYSVAEGYATSATNFDAHAEGGNTLASGMDSHAEGTWTQAIGNQSHAEGTGSTASGFASHAEGSSYANGTASHAEGSGTANGENSHAEGTGFADGSQAHAEGDNSHAVGINSHTEGFRTSALTLSSHAEGSVTVAGGSAAHSEGVRTYANESASHAEGEDTKASGIYSHAEGKGTVTSNQAEHASGHFNKSLKETDSFGDSGNTLFSVGNGYRYPGEESSGISHNAFEIRQNGDIYIVDPTDNGNYYQKQLIKLDPASRAQVDEMEAVTAAALNDLDRRKVGKAELEELEVVTAAGLNDLDVRKASTEYVDRNDIKNSYLIEEEATVFLTFENGSGDTICDIELTQYMNQKADVYNTAYNISGNSQTKTIVLQNFDSSHDLGSTSLSSWFTNTIESGNTAAISSDAVYQWTDGVKMKKITQSDYDALVQAGTVDPNTLYIITD